MKTTYTDCYNEQLKITCVCCTGEITLNNYRIENNGRILDDVENDYEDHAFIDIARKVLIKDRGIYVCTNCYRQKSIELLELEKKRKEILLRKELNWKEWIKKEGVKHGVGSVGSLDNVSESPLPLRHDLLFFKKKR